MSNDLVLSNIYERVDRFSIPRSQDENDCESDYSTSSQIVQ